VEGRKEGRPVFDAVDVPDEYVVRVHVLWCMFVVLDQPLPALKIVGAEGRKKD
jgi:hypothetical protein